MTTYPHGLTECENCGIHYCMGCVGEDCPNCKLKEVGFSAIVLEGILEAIEKWVKNYIDPYLEVDDSNITLFRSEGLELKKILGDQDADAE